MKRTAIGTAIGLCAGAATSFAIDQLFGLPRGYYGAPYPDLADVRTIALFAGIGAITGTVAGGVADLLDVGRRVLAELSLTHGPEADYREPPPSPPSLTTGLPKFRDS